MDIRWKQRYSNFEKAFRLLGSALGQTGLTKLEQEGVIQRFEYTFELAWKTLRDYLRHQGIETDLPRDVLKQAFANRLIENGQIWIEMLESRNLMAHTYDEAAFEAAFHRIQKEFFPALKQVFSFFQAKSGA